MNNINNVPFFNRVEVPGSISVFISVITGYKIYWGMLLTICLYTILLFVQIIRSADNNIRPSKWDPTHPEIAKVLQQFETSFLLLADDDHCLRSAPDIDYNFKNRGLLYVWETNELELQENYPIAKAIIDNDV